jgi:putative transposase
VEKQCALLGIHRSGVYYRPQGPDPEDLMLMEKIDKLYMETPFYGSRKITLVLKEQGWNINRKRVVRLMRWMGIEAIYPKPNLSRSNPEHKKYPYLLNNERICRPNQVWAADITYIPVRGGFGYLFAIIDWYSRYVIEWQLSNMLDADFCLEALERALSKGSPEIFNTDQGVQFTSSRFTKRLEAGGIRISMDGKGRALDNIMVERLWRSVKYEEVYPKGYEQLPEVNSGLGMYFPFYNEKRPHQSLNYKRPYEIYFT